ncbi:MAG: rod-binding protein [Pirellulales bacterium]
MNIASLSMPASSTPFNPPSALTKPADGTPDDSELRQKFDSFVGESFYGQVLSAMRKTVGKPAYFHGGQGEKVFGEHLDHVLAQEMAKSNGADFTESMYQLFQLNRR